jgi:hypothetical protein
MPRDYIDGSQTRGDVRQGLARISTGIVLVVAVFAIGAFLTLALAANIGIIR